MQKFYAANLFWARCMTIHLPPDGQLRAITIHEPDASLAVMGFKQIENRGFEPPKSWPLPVTFAVHASKSDIRLTNQDHWDSLLQEPLISEAFDHPDCTGELGSYYFYAQTIIGLVDVIACVDMPTPKLKCEALEDYIDDYFEQWPVEGGPAPDLPRGIWAMGPKCWILANPRRFKTGITCRGYQRIWRVSADIQAEIESGRELLDNPQEMPQIPASTGDIAPAVVGKPKVFADAQESGKVR